MLTKLKRLSALPAIILGLSSAAASPAKTPDTVTVGTYVNQIFGIDLRNNSFNVDFYIWFRWKNDELKPLETFQLVNGRITSRSAVSYKKVAGVNIASARIAATITKFWNIERFPLDHHQLTLEIEDSGLDSNAMVYADDSANSALSDQVQVPGWVISSTRSSVTVHAYKARRQAKSPAEPAQDEFLPSQAPSTYSRYMFATFIGRPGYGRFIKVSLGLFVSVLVAYLAFYVRPKDLSPRVSLGVGAVFAVAASSFSINSMLPETANLTMADRLVMGALACVALSILGTIWSAQLTYRGRDHASRVFDHTCWWLMPVIYSGVLWYALA